MQQTSDVGPHAEDPAPGPGAGTSARPATVAPDRLQDWIDLLHRLYPPDYAEGWDAVGLQVGDPDHDTVSGVLVSLDVTMEVLDEAAERGADLLIAHHPLLFRPLARLTTDTAAGRLALAAARRGIAIAAAHTNVDKAALGTSHPAAAAIGLTDLRPLQPLPPPLETSGLGLVGDLPRPTPLSALAATLAAELHNPLVRLAASDRNRPVTRVAVVGGSGAGMVTDALREGAEALITGDVGHHIALDAMAMGLAIIDAGHWGTEWAAMRAVDHALAMAAHAQGLTAAVHSSLLSTDPWTDDWT